MEISRIHGPDSTPYPPAMNLAVVLDRAEAFQRVRHAALDVPEVREERVAEISSLLMSGALRPDPFGIASAMLGSGILE
jgi:hypothetical protein